MFDDFKASFINLESAEARQRLAIKARAPSDLIQYPVSFLSDCLAGILPNELVVIGADTGCGKSYLANEIAFQSAITGKKTYIFSLEGDREEFVSRLKWNFICRHLAANGGMKGVTYQSYLLNAHSPELEAAENFAMSEIKAANENLIMYSREESLDSEDLINRLAWIPDAKLIVIDHLHYLPFAGDDPEHAQISKTMRTIQTITKIKNIPVVMISHLRKKSKERMLPDNDDFHGSSNIAKEADTCITISPDFENSEGDRLATYFRVTKSRTGAEMRNIGRMFFDRAAQMYLREYELARIYKKGIEDIEPFKIPTWAKNARRAKWN